MSACWALALIKEGEDKKAGIIKSRENYFLPWLEKWKNSLNKYSTWLVEEKAACISREARDIYEMSEEEAAPESEIASKGRVKVVKPAQKTNKQQKLHIDD